MTGPGFFLNVLEFLFVKQNFLKSNVIFLSLEEFLWPTTTSVATFVRVKFMEIAINIPSIDLNKTAERINIDKKWKNSNKRSPVTCLWILVRESNKLSSFILFSHGIYYLLIYLPYLILSSIHQFHLYFSMILFRCFVPTAGIDIVLTYSTLHNTATTWLQHLLAPAMQEDYAMNHTIRICSNPYFLFVMDTYWSLDTANRRHIFTFIYFAY